MAELWSGNNLFFNRLKASVILLFPALLYLIPLDLIKGNESMCLYKMATGHECYGCGMTRAVFSALHFHFREAWEFNRMVVAVLPLLIYIWAKQLIKYLPSLKVTRQVKS
jgi:hypothetical protein